MKRIHLRTGPVLPPQKEPTDSEKLRAILTFPRVEDHDGAKFLYDVLVRRDGTYDSFLREIQFPLGFREDLPKNVIKPGTLVTHTSTGDKGVVFSLGPGNIINVRWFDGGYDECFFRHFAEGQLQAQQGGSLGGESKLHTKKS